MQALLSAGAIALPVVPLHFLSNVPRPHSPQPAQSNSQKLCWEIIVEKLPARDAQTEWYTLADIAPLVNLNPNSLSKHCRDLWPGHTGHWRLDHAQAVRLIRRVCVAGKKVKL